MKSFQVLLVGDVFIKNELNESFLSEELQVLFDNCEIRGCNFEAPLFEEGLIPIQKIGPVLSQCPDAAKYVLDHGFNLINCSNNHITDYGKNGLLNTLVAFKNVDVIGAGRSFEDAYDLKIVEKKGCKVGFLGFAEWGFDIFENKLLDGVGFAWVNHASVNEIIKSSKLKVDTLVVQVHAGAENVFHPLPEWRKRYKEIIDCGADVVIAHHPHVAQGWESYHGCPIFYSLGNFYFDKENATDIWNSSYAVILKLGKNKNLSFEVVYTHKSNQKVSICRDPQYIKRLEENCSILNDDLRYLDEINQQTMYQWRTFYKKEFRLISFYLIFPKIFNSILFIKRIVKKKRLFPFRMFYHFIKIETHRYNIQRALFLLDKNKRL